MTDWWNSLQGQLKTSSDAQIHAADAKSLSNLNTSADPAAARLESFRRPPRLRSLRSIKWRRKSQALKCQRFREGRRRQQVSVERSTTMLARGCVPPTPEKAKGAYLLLRERSGRAGSKRTRPARLLVTPRDCIRLSTPAGFNLRIVLSWQRRLWEIAEPWPPNLDLDVHISAQLPL